MNTQQIHLINGIANQQYLSIILSPVQVDVTEPRVDLDALSSKHDDVRILVRVVDSASDELGLKLQFSVKGMYRG